MFKLATTIIITTKSATTDGRKWNRYRSDFLLLFRHTYVRVCVHTSYLKTKKITHNLASLSDQKKGNKEFF